jgi:3-hydroxyisobutyrate dehydrogenase-like beta-hydroxyacid dehydrogenase
MADTSMIVGFVGLGRMGRQMAARLAAAGFPLRVWNRTRDKAQGLPGATVCASAREAASGAAVVVSSLADDPSVRAVVLGDDGILAGLSEGAVHVSASTISVRLARELSEAHEAAHRRLVVAAVLGRPEAAARGELWVLTGGGDEEVARVRPVLAAISQGEVRLGQPAQAMLGKIIANFMIAGTIELLAEATSLGEKGGLPAGEVVGMLTRTLFGSPVVKGYGARIAAGEYQPAGFPLPLGLKDVELALESSHDMRAPLPVAAVVRDHMLATLARGRDDWDWSGLASAVREAAGLGAAGSGPAHPAP